LSRPGLKFEIDPHMSAAIFEFTTLVYQPPTGTTGWQEHTDITADPDAEWWLTGDEGTEIGCNQTTFCSFSDLVNRLQTHTDLDEEAPRVTTGLYFGLGADDPNSAAVDNFQFGGFTFDFEPNGVFILPPE
jgi:hypothetical protein